jgi:outer membrane protein OmpA-like peptidoglycan-associated protein
VIDENGNPSQMTWHEALDLAARSAMQSMQRLKELILIGHTDSLGTDAYNERLGFRRASFVAQQLEARGVPHRIIRIESKGRTQPVNLRADESDDLFRLRSRRVEFIKVFK